MERKSYVCRNLKHHSLGKIHHNHPSWENCSIECETSTTTIVDLVAAGGSRFSWPPRTYSCSFCKREFRSAQALGGHMNVHRRDRARLRQSSPPHPPPPKDNHHSNNLLNLNLHSNPNPNPNISSTSSSLPSFSPGETVKRRTGDTGVGLAKMKMERNVFGYGELEGFEQDRKGCRVRLDLEIGVGRDLKEDVDLELRLGYS